VDGKPSPWFGQYPADFFDFIVIDECHRGGANNESTWRGILEYFAPAVQLGLTATPRRAGNTDTYAYFGDPMFTYSLKEGINDGFLTPFRVKQITTTLKARIKLGDGKERSIQHMMVTSFWHPDGTPMSSQQFLELRSQISPKRNLLTACIQVDQLLIACLIPLIAQSFFTPLTGHHQQWGRL
jgi:superfamily II DNA or RNA helicase